MTCLFFFFFNDPPTAEIYTLSLHDALPIFGLGQQRHRLRQRDRQQVALGRQAARLLALLDERAEADRKSTRLNSSHTVISYAVFCLKKKKTLSIIGICLVYFLCLLLRIIVA